MKPVAIAFATNEGHTRRIAERFAFGLKRRGLEAVTLEVGDAMDTAPSEFAAIGVAASAHGGRHQRDAIRYVRRHRSTIEGMPNAFISVSLSEAGAEDPALPAAVRIEHGAAVRGMIDRFVDETGWRPCRVFPVAGALRYTRYNLLLRWVMKRIARRAKGATDTSRDHVYTDWVRLDSFAGSFASDILERMRRATTAKAY